MAAQGSAYRGDEHLAALLRDSQVGRKVEEVRDLVAGVAAAPSATDPRAWLVLVGSNLSPDLEAQLLALRDMLAAPKPPLAAATRLANLRAELARQGLDGFVIPYSDEHQGEYIPARARRLAWLTGFTGSAGTAVVLGDSAAVFVDGRYTLQVRAQVPADLYEYRHLVEESHTEWAARSLPRGGRLGYDPRLHTIGWVEKAKTELDRIGGQLVAVDRNPVDAVWTDQPPAPISPVVPHDVRHAGKPSAEKREELAMALRDAGCAAAVLTQAESVAWLLNVRGADVPHTPLPLANAILRDDGTVDLFIDRRKLSPGLEAHLGNTVAIQPPETLGPALEALGRTGGKVRVDPATANAWVFERLHKGGAQPVRETDPCALPRACKNPVEQEGSRQAHMRDAGAVARFMHWISQVGPTGEVDEIDAAEHLRRLRAEDPLFRDISFDTISGAGPNGAIVHYRSTPETNRRIETGSLYLVDSGAQYLDGTTDITRTIAIGTPTPEMRRRFTLVLKGHIALSTTRFPKGTTGSQLDALARQFLWQEGLDYDHGTGHGVGSYLGVHEGPARIAKQPNTIPLEPGMILSNEPGYYKAGAYGIRIENLVLVQPCTELPDAERPMLCFETLTLAPIDRNLVEPGLLTAREAAWLDAYHARVRAALSGRLPADTEAWLAGATAPIAPLVAPGA
ncbi:MAG TPA: aminopeptidase P family protein [Azospirillaceae bacterium]|nr:aminopeptidase P family protein [Azospirillaceae bacterium]